MIDQEDVIMPRLSLMIVRSRGYVSVREEKKGCVT